MCYSNVEIMVNKIAREAILTKAEEYGFFPTKEIVYPGNRYSILKWQWVKWFWAPSNAIEEELKELEGSETAAYVFVRMDEDNQIEKYCNKAGEIWSNMFGAKFCITRPAGGKEVLWDEGF